MRHENLSCHLCLFSVWRVLVSLLLDSPSIKTLAVPPVLLDINTVQIFGPHHPRKMPASSASLGRSAPRLFFPLLSVPSNARLVRNTSFLASFTSAMWLQRYPTQLLLAVSEITDPLLLPLMHYKPANRVPLSLSAFCASLESMSATRSEHSLSSAADFLHCHCRYRGSPQLGSSRQIESP